MTQYVVRRLLLFVPTLLLVTGIIFAVLRVIPGDVAKLIVTGGAEGQFSQQAYLAVRRQLGLDQPIAVQYLHWAGAALHGDLGTSYWAKDSVRDELFSRLPVTLELAIAAPILALLLGIPLGIISAVRHNSPLDHLARAISITGLAVPHFWLGIIIILLLANYFGWVIPLRYADVWQDPWLNVQQMFWPVIVLATGFMALLARVTRSAMLEVLRSDYIRTAQAKGLRNLTVIGRHALKNAILPIATIFGAQLGGLISGAVVTEQVFNIPGMGRFFVAAVFQRDFPVVQAAVLLIALAYLVVNLIVDLIYGWIDPRIRYA